MNISIMSVIGPVMIGPSSSHTAGAARLGAAARSICGQEFDRAEFGLHGSFAKTYRGHGTDLALLAGVLGMAPDDERIPEAFTIANRQGLKYRFYEKELEDVHENAVRIRFFKGEKLLASIIGSSIGGGRIMVNELNGCRIDLSAEYPTLVINHRDVKGVISHITGVLAEESYNVGTLKLTRNTRGDQAWSIIELDEPINGQLPGRIKQLPDVLSVQAVQIE